MTTADALEPFDQHRPAKSVQCCALVSPPRSWMTGFGVVGRWKDTCLVCYVWFLPLSGQQDCAKKDTSSVMESAKLNPGFDLIRGAWE